MALHTLFPAYLRLTYSGSEQPHHAILPVEDDGAWVGGTEPDVLDVIGGSHSLSDAIDDYLAVIKPLFAAATVFSTVEAFLFDNPDAGSVFIFGKNLVGQAGTGGGTRTPRQQAVLTMRTALGGSMRAALMETNFSVDQRVVAADLTGDLADWRDYFLSDTCVVHGRDLARAIFAVNFITKENDTLRHQAGI